MDTTKPGQEPAFPVECQYNEQGMNGGVQTGDRTGWATGLTKRELIAAMCLQGLVAAHGNLNSGVGKLDDLARSSILFADALLTHLNTKQP